jgi:hypothetical protein
MYGLGLGCVGALGLWQALRARLAWPDLRAAPGAPPRDSAK